ncbi:hypothetical protein L2E82_40163 [Cichorium intybus]|uniref:Uncharacterized protein n=1 Tax=Cichorium intybus TaxID=13427 RepID=A0ACB9AKK9_CICIN|nr:hypothetical protein L2E82_40163 [Cichorium intybus]
MLLQDQQFVNIRLGFTIYSITPGCSCNKSICRINTRPDTAPNNGFLILHQIKLKLREGDTESYGFRLQDL